MLIVILSFEKIIHWLENHSLPCFYKKYLGIECPGCGMQRSFIELLKGNFLVSFKLYPALTTTFILFIFLLLHIIFKFKNGAKYLLIIFAINAIIIIINYFLKI